MTLSVNTNEIEECDIDQCVEEISGQEATLALWEANADYFLKEYSKHKQERFVFVVVTSVVVKQYIGNKHIATSPGSKNYLNIEAKEVRELREKHAINNPAEDGVQLIPARVQPTYEEQITHNQMTIDQLFSATIPPGEDFLVCTCEATIVDIEDEKLSNSPLLRPMCRVFGKLHPQVHARVRDPSGEAVFVLFNSDTERLIGLSIDQIMQETKESGSITDTPPLLRNLQGMSPIFQLKISSFNTERCPRDYTVTRVFQPNKKGQKRSLLLLDGNGSGDDADPSTLKRKIKIEKE